MTDLIATKITAIEADVRQMADRIEGVAVQSDEDYAGATNVLGEIKARMKRIDTLRKEFTDPLKDQVKLIDNKFKMQMEPLERMDQVIRARMLDYYNAKEARLLKEAEERRKAEEERRIAEQPLIEAGLIDAPQPVLPLPAPERTVRTENAVASVQKRWDYRVTNIAQIPVEYLTVDSALIRKQINAGNREIPGLEIFQTNVVAIR